MPHRATTSPAGGPPSKPGITQNRRKIIYSVLGLASFLLLLQILPSSKSSFRTPKWTANPLSFRQGLMRKSGSKVVQRPPIQHPIPKLMARAKDNFEKKLHAQSKTLEAAIAEYRKRYEMDPPKGFDEWFQFAKDNQVDMIDEYDQLMRDLAPFRQFSGSEVRERAIQVGYLPSVDLVRVQNGTTRTIDVNKGFDDSEVGARAKGFRVMLEKFQDKLPDMDFPINEKAEGRILVPWEQNLYHNLTADASRKSSVCLGVMTRRAHLG